MQLIIINTNEHEQQRRFIPRVIIVMKKIWTPLPRNSDNNMP